MSQRIGIIGAGISGLSAAQRLIAAGHAVDLFDKGRGPGGRMSTRRERINDRAYLFDHGAQYFTVRDPRFVSQVDHWVKHGLAARWPDAGPDAFVGTPMMCSPLASLCEHFGVRFATRIKGIIGAPGAWYLEAENETFGPYAKVIVAIPPEQAADLLTPRAVGFGQTARSHRSQPCWTTMVSFEQDPPDLPPMMRVPGPVLAWVANNAAKPSRAKTSAWVLQATPDWTAAYIDLSREDAAAPMFAAWQALLGRSLPQPVLLKAHLWRYARTGEGEKGLLYDKALGLGVCGDWLKGPRVEAAWLSGLELAEALLAA